MSWVVDRMLAGERICCVFLLVIAATCRGESISETAVVSIFSCDSKGIASHHATGFFVSSDGKIASTRHAIKVASKLVIQLDGGRILDVAGVIAEDPLHDLVLLQVKGTGFPFLRLSAFDQVRRNDRVRTVINNYTNREWERDRRTPNAARVPGKIIKGSVVAVENLADDYQWLSVRMPIRGGVSGSPILNDAGEVIGMARGSMGDANTCVAVSVDYVRQLLAAPPWASAPRAPAQLSKRDYDELFDDVDFKGGMAAAGRGRYLEAALQMELAAKHFPGSGAFHLLLGSYYSRLARDEDARREYEKAIAIKPDNAVAWASMALYYAQHGKPAEAAAACDKLAAMSTSMPDTWYNAAAACLLLKRYDETRKYIQRLRGFKTPRADEMAGKLEFALQLAAGQPSQAQP